MANSVVVAWAGRLPLQRTEFFVCAVRVGRKFVDARDRNRPASLDQFVAGLAQLRKQAPPGGHILIDELVHRWVNPGSPPALYVLECNAAFIEEARQTPSGATAEFSMTKIGKAARSLAPRLVGYIDDGMTDLTLTPGSLTLRLVIYGHGASMVSEKALKKEAHRNGNQLWTRWSERFEGADLIEQLTQYAEGKQIGSGFASDIFYGSGVSDEKHALLRTLLGSENAQLARGASDYLRSLARGQEAADL